MEATGIGTAIMLAIAAALWFLYLVPTWLKRREYLATERTATRLQQTLRIMAETAETPEIVRVEARVREAVRQERALRAEERAARRRLAAQLRREEAAERAADRAAIAAAARIEAEPDPAALRRRRMRRTRALASLLMIAATVVGGMQIALIATTGAVPASWGVLAVAGAGACVAVSVQRRLDARRAPRTAADPVAASTPVAVPVAVAPAAPAREWTPVPLPRPRYLDRPAPQPIVPPLDAAALRRAAAAEAAEAECARIAAHAEPEVVPFRRREERAVPAATASRFAGMGLLDPRDTAAPDLDEVLRRRRSAV
ncbi:hypothetical protein [Pseudolysinimonas sp.]|uniref:hypothetical protein n=1 Tax=Pseudolysinimonas sp. TaxID=2680009 RepID=UPI003F7D9B1D